MGGSFDIFSVFALYRTSERLNIGFYFPRNPFSDMVYRLSSIFYSLYASLIPLVLAFASLYYVDFSSGIFSVPLSHIYVLILWFKKQHYCGGSGLCNFVHYADDGVASFSFLVLFISLASGLMERCVRDVRACIFLL